MRAIVTGAAGFIGAELVRQLRAEGVETLSVVHTVGLADAVRADLRQPGALDGQLSQGAVVYHLAGRADVGASLRDPQADFDLNLAAAVNVLESARRAGAAVILASTGSVYDLAAPSPLSEDAPLRPVSPYGASKAAADLHALAYHAAFGLDVRVARLFSIYGPGRRGMAIADFAERLRQAPERLQIRGDGGQVRDYLHVADAARALRIIAESGEPGGVYNVGSGRGRRMDEVARCVAVAAGYPDCQIAPDGIAREGELFEMVADISRLAALGFAPRIAFEDGLTGTVASILGMESQTT